MYITHRALRTYLSCGRKAVSLICILRGASERSGPRQPQRVTPSKSIRARESKLLFSTYFTSVYSASFVRYRTSYELFGNQIFLADVGDHVYSLVFLTSLFYESGVWGYKIRHRPTCVELSSVENKCSPR